MYIGRGDYEFNEWEAAREEAENNMRLDLVKYLLSIPHFPEYLKEGLNVLGYSLEDTG